MSLQDKLSDVIDQHELTGDGCACGGWAGTVSHSDHVAAWLVAVVRDVSPAQINGSGSMSSSACTDH